MKYAPPPAWLDSCSVSGTILAWSPGMKTSCCPAGDSIRRPAPTRSRARQVCPPGRWPEENDPPAARGNDALIDVVRSATGVDHVSPRWVDQHSDEVRLIDVHQPEALEGPPGAHPQAELAPPGEVPAASGGRDQDEPLILIRRSNDRPDRPASRLEQRGLRRVASMVSGMLARREQAPPSATA